MLRETLLALLVLAVTFLNFGHSNVAYAGDGHYVVGAASFCGSLGHPDQGPVDHQPCHACRIGGGADLPPPPRDTAAASFAAAPVVYAATVGEQPIVAIPSPANPRGPPAV